MIALSEDLIKILSERLKVGDRSRPTCKVEIDRLAFIPGRVTSLNFDAVVSCYKEVSKSWTEGNSIYEKVPITITYPIQGGSFSNAIVTSEFGPRGKSYHHGIDIACPTGTNIVAAWDGVVLDVKRDKSYGLYVKVDNGDGLVTLYAHLKEAKVSAMQWISAGDVIGISDNTGNSTGPHLHFEIRQDGKYVNPRPYLEGKKKANTTTVRPPSSEEISSATVEVAEPGVVVLLEKFKTKNWYDKDVYKVSDAFKSISSVTKVDPYDLESSLICNFKDGVTTRETGFDITLNLRQKSFLDFSYITNFSTAEGDDFRVKINGTDAVTKVFDGIATDQEVRGVYVPQGKVTISFYIKWGGIGNKQVTFNFIKVQELNIKKQNADNSSLAEFFQLEDKTSLDLPIGQFVYMDTITLKNVSSIETGTSLEQECAEARIVISNINGFYSPDYNPVNFPELYQDSPWSYYINGFNIGVLSDNTPIRIYLGYGDNLVRVFTGLIDKIDESGENLTLTITCRDMYKKIVGKVLTERKAYPEDYNAITQGISLTGKNAIAESARVQAAKFGVDYKFLLAICQHETVFGTEGWGRPSQGSYVLGYGCYSETDADPAYAGIDTQMYYGAKRMAQALASRGKKVTSRDDVEYFRTGGDIGLVWSPTLSWTDAVWGYYQDIIAHSKYWDSVSTGNLITSDSNVRWLKSAVVQDLVSHAGMFGWRGNEEDRNYPDAVIEETYLIEVNQRTGKVIKAVPDEEGKFIEEDIQSYPTPYGWMNPFVEECREFPAFQTTVSECINEVMKDTNYRSYCDRYGTYRFETINLYKPVIAEFNSGENLITIEKTIDFSRARSHILVYDNNSDVNSIGGYANFIDKEILLELKGEIRTAVVVVPWAVSYEAKKEVAKRMFFDMKRICRTLQVVVPGNPALDILDRVWVKDKNTATCAVYTIKGIKHILSEENGFITNLELMWSGGDETICQV